VERGKNKILIKCNNIFWQWCRGKLGDWTLLLTQTLIQITTLVKSAQSTELFKIILFWRKHGFLSICTEKDGMVHFYWLLLWPSLIASIRQWPQRYGHRNTKKIANSFSFYISMFLDDFFYLTIIFILKVEGVGVGVLNYSIYFEFQGYLIFMSKILLFVCYKIWL